MTSGKDYVISTRFTANPLEHAAVDQQGGLVLAFDSYIDGQNRYHPASIRRHDAATGSVIWEYVVIGSLSKVALHPDGRVFTSELPYYGADTYLTAISASGAVQKWPLPKGHLTRFVDGVKYVDTDLQPDPSPPLIQEDGSVVIVSLTERTVTYWTHDDVDPDNRSFIMPSDSQAEAPTQLHVILNWSEELKRRFAAGKD